MINNQNIMGAFFKAIGYLDPDKNIVVSVSGGSDSDIIVDFIDQCGYTDKVNFIFIDTGVEYQATKNHLGYLESRYGIEIERVRAIKSIPQCCKDHGQPFINKFFSNCIERLQRNNFNWVDKPYNELIKLYPNCRSALKWWCNEHTHISWNIGYKKYLKEFMIKNPPHFKISSKCCDIVKKRTVKEYYKKNNTEIVITGLRKSEGGIRSISYDSCYSVSSPDHYRPIWWLTDQDKIEYEQKYGIVHSDCYTKYGFKRTGCACCPFALNLAYELDIAHKFEPNLYKVAQSVFSDSYKYTHDFYVYRNSEKIAHYLGEIKTKPLENWGP